MPSTSGSRVSTLEHRLRDLQKRPLMYLPARRYEVLVAYIEGFEAGSNSDDLIQFQGWAAREVLGEPSAFHWSTLVASRVRPELLDGATRLSILTDEESDRASADLFALLLRFLAGRGSGC